MTVSPLVSVIIPNYNHAIYLDERIQSILDQTYQNFEVIILDDKSTDNSLEVINKYRDNPHISKIVCNEENSGSPFKQWHKGFELAKGELIWIAESDDSCEPILLQSLVENFENVENLVLAFCRSQVIDEKGIKHNIFQKPFRKNLYNGHEFIKNHLIWGNCVVNASSALFRKNIVGLIYNGYMNFRGVGDWLFWTEIVEHGDVAIVNKPLNFYRYYEYNTTSKNRNNGFEVVEAKRVFDYFLSHSHLSWIDALRIKKKYVRYIKYDAHFSEKLKKDLLIVWNNNWCVDLLAKMSDLIHKYL